MSLAPGMRVGGYEVVSLLGAGGMGEVYRAHDPALGRDLALKVLPETFARDEERVARFEREARTLASLNHPNIAQVYGFQDGILVLELLEGETLRDRLKTGALPIRKAIDVAGQLARGLAAAYERGIVHRDLKPENVFLLRDGHAKILDFGLAASTAPSGSGESQTIAALTGAGTVLGTVGYMAPEQVRGEPLDHRADLFSLGAVLYEMLTGQRAFQRDTAAETMTAILREDPPDLGSSRADVTPALDRIVRHCLEKNPVERFQTARDVAFALDALSGSAPSTAQAPPHWSAAAGGARLWKITALVSAAAAIALAVWPVRRAAVAVAALPYVASLPLPEGVRFSLNFPPAMRLAISPDGKKLAFVGVRGVASSARPALFVQSLDQPMARVVAGGDDAYAPFWSPDSRTLGFLIRDRIYRVEPGSGVPTAIVGVTGASAFLDERRILFFDRAGQIRELRPPATAARVLLGPSVAGEEYGFPVPLPGGGFLFGYRNQSAPDREGIYVANADGTETRLLLANRESMNAAYANGRLLFVRNRSILAQPFDLERGALTGDPVVVAESVAVSGAAFANSAFSVSTNGTLVYEPGGQQVSRLNWMSRAGAVTGTLGEDADYSNVELSPDGSRLVVSVADPALKTRDIWVADVARGVMQRLTFDSSEERSAAWSSDGTRVIYTSRRLDLYARAANGGGPEEALLTDGRSKDPRMVSPDGKRLLYRRSGDSTGNDLWILPLEGDRTPIPVLETPFSENYSLFSPDGSSIVYVSDESGVPEVYVLSLDGSGGKVRISTGGGTFPRWRGREIFYLDPEQRIMSVAVEGVGRTFKADVARPLFRIAVQPGAGVPFDVTPDGQRFIINTELSLRSGQAFTLIVNWPALLGR